MSLRRAIKHYEMWHQKPHDRVEEMNLTLPPSMRKVGIADEIEYRSDKWEDDGKFYPYEHAFTSRPTVYMGDKRAPLDTRRFFSLQTLNDTLAWPLLAFVETLSIREPGKPHKTVLRFGRDPIMCCADERTVVILHDSLIAIRGGSMVVTERGIVK